MTVCPPGCCPEDADIGWGRRSGHQRCAEGRGGDPESSSAAAGSPVQAFEAGLRSAGLWAVDESGRRMRLPVERWRGPLQPGDSGLLDRCSAPTLDVGCGPGRLLAALAGRGVEALGVDVSPAAVAMARARGGAVLLGSVFDPVPSAGSWHTALLVDGNIGIGGNPVELLRRVRSLLAAGGSVLVELDATDPGYADGSLRLQDAAGRLSEQFPWARVGRRSISAVAAAAGLEVRQRWNAAGRAFATLTRRPPDLAAELR